MNLSSNTVTAVSLSLLMTVFSAAAYAGEFDKQKAVDEAKSITKAFAGELQKTLKAAMQSGGPVNALSVCNVEAIPISDGVSAAKDASVSRVSLKNRNPDNVPNDWQKSVLLDFDARAAAGESIEKMASVDVVDNNDKKQLRFMKAIPTGGVCMACHGGQLDAEVQSKLDELYPDDKATGYQPGDVRGAIVVIKDY